MSFRQASVTEHDIPAMETLNFDAFEYFAARRLMIPRRTAGLQQHQEKKSLKALTSARNYHARALFDDSNDGKLVAFAKWRLEDEVEHARQEDDSNAWAPDSNFEMKRAFFGHLDKQRKAVMGDKTYWHLTLLATDPKYERRGCASQLLKWGTDQADKAGLEIYLDSTSPGFPVYKRHGFELVQRNEFDLRPWGGDHIHTTQAMVRQPWASQSL